MCADAVHLSLLLPAAILDLEWDYTLRNVVLGSAVLGAVGGVFGSFATLRRQSLLGDALAHAALPGVCLAFLVTGAKGSLALMVGAALSGLIGTLVFLAVVRQSRVKEDAALGIVLSVFFGFGILLLTRIQHSGDAAQSGLDRFLFGQAATLVAGDVRLMAILGAVALSIVWLLFKELKVVTFDPEFAASVGFATTPLTILLTALIVVAVVIGLQTVGVILMVAMLIAPPAAARQWTDRLGTMLVLAAVFGVAAGVSGAVLSSQVARLPTGPTIVLFGTALAAGSVLVAPRRGVLWAAARRWRQRRQIQSAALLRDLAGLSGAGAVGVSVSSLLPVPEAQLAAGRGEAVRKPSQSLRALARRGLVERDSGPEPAWRLTTAGIEAARAAMHRERLWKLYLARQMDLPVESVHHGAAEIERVLPPAVLASLEAELAADNGRLESRPADISYTGTGAAARAAHGEGPA